MECLAKTDWDKYQSTSSANFDNCAYILLSNSEYKESGLFNLSIEDATILGVAILSVWATAFTFRVLYKFIKDS